ncbi:MAG: hypothetical protein WD048_08325 [Chitinophagales bacterium]
MKSLSLNFLLLLCLSLTFISCNKDDSDDNDDQTTTQQTAPNTTPDAPGDADGVLAAVNSIQSMDISEGVQIPGAPSTLDVEFNIAVAAFFENKNTESYVAAGDVTVNTDNTLEIQDNNSYVTAYDATSTDGMDLGFSAGSTVEWKVSGSADVDAFTFTTTKRMPGDVTLEGDYKEVDISANLTVSIDKVSTNADSVLFFLAGENDKYVKFTAAGNATSHTFTSAELSVLTGTGVVQVVPFTIEPEEFGGKNFYFVNEVVVTSFTEFK